MDPGVGFTWNGLGKGLRAGLTPAGGSVIYGVAFGLLADQAGLSMLATMAMSILVYSGSAQMVGLQAWADPIPLATIAAAIVAVNARYFLLGAALRPWFGSLPAAQSYGSLFFLGDGNWAPGMREYQEGRRDAAFLLGAGLTMFAGWVGGTGAGHELGQVLGDTKRLGLDFILPGYFVIMAFGLWRGKADLLPLAAASLAALVAQHLVEGQWYMLIGALAGSLAAALNPPEEPKPHGV
jgi:predicted branched-subunit amino acid permease